MPWSRKKTIFATLSSLNEYYCNCYHFHQITCGWGPSRQSYNQIMKLRVPPVRYGHSTEPDSEAETNDRWSLDDHFIENNRSQINLSYLTQVSNTYFSLTSYLNVPQESDDSTLRKSGNRDSADDFTRYHRLYNFAYILFTRRQIKKTCFAKWYLESNLKISFKYHYNR